MKKRINKEIIIVAIISVLFLMMSIVYADYLYNSNQVSFNNNNTTLTSTDVQSAIDELYNKCSNIPAVGSCPEGYECTPLNRVTYNANGGSFSNSVTTNDVYYSVIDTGQKIEKISKTINIDEEGNILTTGSYAGYMPQADSGITNTVTIEGAESLEVEITYQTYSSSYSWVAVYNASVTPTTSNYSSSVSGKLYGTTITTKTYTISGDTVKFFFYNSKSHTSSYSNYYGYYAKVKGKKNGNYLINYDVTKEEGEYSEPSNSNKELRFVGWTENADGSGTLYKSEQEVMDSLDTENRSVVLYAKYISKYICKRSTTLHTETCSNGSSSNNYYCYGDGYYASGRKKTTTITYGSLGTKDQEPSVGDAFDCDVNGDGIYNATNERFYYVSTYFDTSTMDFDNDYYTFVYYSDTYSGQIVQGRRVEWYWGNNDTSYGPETAKNHLPTTSQWRKGLLKTTTRNILGGSLYSSQPTTFKSDFSYEGYAARLLTLKELESTCSPSISVSGPMAGCNFLFERTAYSSSSIVTKGLWLESPYNSSQAWVIDVTDRRVYWTDVYYGSYVNSGKGGVRPVIEVNKNNVLY